MNNPRCPRCNRLGKPIRKDLWQCPVGHGFFDGDNDGIVATHSDPAKAAESKEEFENRQKQRKQRR